VAVLVGLVLRAVTLGTSTPSIPALVDAGAKVDELVARGEWWRVVSAGMLHASVAHLLLNCVMLGFATFAWVWLVRDEGWSRAVLALTLVVLTSALAFVTSFVAHAGASVGASGAANGMLAAIVAGVWVRRQALPTNLHKSGPLALTVAFVVVLAFSWTMGGADHAAHLGGAIAGAVLGYLVDAWPRTRGVFVGVAVALVVSATVAALR